MICRPSGAITNFQLYLTLSVVRALLNSIFFINRLLITSRNLTVSGAGWVLSLGAIDGCFNAHRTVRAQSRPALSVIPGWLDAIAFLFRRLAANEMFIIS